MARPKLPEDRKRKKRCEILFTEKEWQKLCELANEEEISVPQFVRLLIKNLKQ